MAVRVMNDGAVAHSVSGQSNVMLMRSRGQQVPVVMLLGSEWVREVSRSSMQWSQVFCGVCAMNVTPGSYHCDSRRRVPCMGWVGVAVWDCHNSLTWPRIQTLSYICDPILEKPTYRAKHCY